MKTSLMNRKLFAYLFWTVIVAVAAGLVFSSCEEDKEEPAPITLVGQPGNPRFNLVFTNEDNVDLDLYVRDPSGETIYYGNMTSASGGEFDVDCLCDDCPQGANENIFWVAGTAPAGTYTYWVEYYGSCNGEAASSDFTLRVVRNSEIIETHTGTLSSGSSNQWTITQP